MKSIYFFCSFFILLFSCNIEKDTEVNPKIQELYGQALTFVTDRNVDPIKVQFPHHEFSEPDFTPIPDHLGSSYTVVLSEDGQGVNIYPDNLAGEFLNWKDNKLYFELTEGAFAGGRFVVWTLEDGYQAEYTLYGSGVPIVFCSRGTISKP